MPFKQKEVSPCLALPLISVDYRTILTESCVAGAAFLFPPLFSFLCLSDDGISEVVTEDKDEGGCGGAGEGEDEEEGADEGEGGSEGEGVSDFGMSLLLVVFLFSPVGAQIL